MTKPNFTSINVLIDRSGSMGSLTTDTIGGFNTFLQEQKDTPGEAIFTLCLFDTRYQIVQECVPLAEAVPLNTSTYRPSGGTALLDALGQTINKVGVNLSNMNEEDRPSKVIFLVITDGEENSSTEFAIEKIKEMVTHQRDVYSWEFVFMGANIDSIAAGASLGVSTANSMNYVSNSVGTKGLYATASASLRNYRAGASSKADFFGPADQVPDPSVLATPAVLITPVDLAAQPLVTPPLQAQAVFSPNVDFLNKNPK